MRVLVTVHRWWGLAFCLLFAMWFASGIVMHFMPFPARTEQHLASGTDMSRASTEQIEYDQWTLGGDFDIDRPLKHIVLNDAAGTEIYVSSRSSNVVLATTRRERLLNYLGSIPHWVYQTELRHHNRAWNALMWSLSLMGTIGVALGVFLGLVRLRADPAYHGPRWWHHISGLIVAPFVLSWVFSGFLSMDDGWFAHSDVLFRTLHTLDFPLLKSHSWLRSVTIVVLCLCGFAFSITGVILAWQSVTKR
jgi:hypothetical protein